MKYTIFSEGKDDRSFIEDYLKHLLGQTYNDYDIEYVSTGGWTNLNRVLPKFKQTSDIGGRNLVLFDADFVHTNGGFETRQRALNRLKTELHIQFELFLFPNNSEDGIFENLLENIVVSDHYRIIECFNSYEQCIQQYNQDNIYNAPVQKSKIYAYIETVANRREFEQSRKNNNNKCFSNTNYWHLESDRISSLRTFFTDNII